MVTVEMGGGAPNSIEYRVRQVKRYFRLELVVGQNNVQYLLTRRR